MIWPRACLTGTRLGHYEVKERLGVGGMAVVYRAVQSSFGREVARGSATGSYDCVLAFRSVKG